MVLTPAAVTVSSDGQFSKALEPIVMRLSGNVTVVSAAQFLKALVPIVTAPSGSVREVMPDPAKASSQ